MARPTTNVSPPQTQALQRSNNPAALLANAIVSRKSAFSAVANRHFNTDRMIKLAQAALSRTPKLAMCTQSSVLVTLMRCAELGLEPNSPLGGMHLVPFKNKSGQMECQGILDYRAMVELVRRSGELLSIFAEVRYEKDKWERRLGTDPVIVHLPAEDADRGEILGFYAVAKLRSGEVAHAYMSKGEVDTIRSRSRAGSSGPWVTDYTEMGKKTVLRRICKLLPMQTETKRVVADEDLAESGVRPPIDTETLEALAVADDVEAEPSTEDAVAKALGAAPAKEGPTCEVCGGPPPLNAGGLCGNCAPPDEGQEPGSQG